MNSNVGGRVLVLKHRPLRPSPTPRIPQMSHHPKCTESQYQSRLHHSLLSLRRHLPRKSLPEDDPKAMLLAFAPLV